MITIIIPTWDNYPFLVRCIESLRNTRGADYRLLVIDNGSSDGTSEYLKENGIPVIRNETNLGWVKAVNQGLAQVRLGEDVLLLNDDTQIVEPWWLGRLQYDLESRKELGAVGPVTAVCAGLQNIGESYYLPEMHAANYLVGFCMLIRAAAVQKVGLLDERVDGIQFDDFDYSIRLREAGYALRVNRSVYVHHYGLKTTQRDGQNLAEQLARGQQELVNKWGARRVKATFRLPNELLAADSIWQLENKHAGETCWIVGKGPSLMRLAATDIGAGPVLAINQATVPVERLGLPNPVYALYKDGCVPMPPVEIEGQPNPAYAAYLDAGRPRGAAALEPGHVCDPQFVTRPRSATVLVSAAESPHCLSDYSPRYVFDNEGDFGIPWDNGALLSAVEIAEAMGCAKVVFVCFDSHFGDCRTYDPASGSLVEYPEHLQWYPAGNQIAEKRLALKGMQVEWRMPLSEDQGSRRERMPQ